MAQRSSKGRRLASLGIVAVALFACSCASLSRGAFLRREGNVIASIEFFLEDYQTEPRVDTQVQLLLSTIEGCARVERAYRRASELERLDRTREQWALIDRHYQLLERAVKATRRNPSDSTSVESLIDEARVAWKRVDDSRDSSW